MFQSLLQLHAEATVDAHLEATEGLDVLISRHITDHPFKLVHIVKKLDTAITFQVMLTLIINSTQL